MTSLETGLGFGLWENKKTYPSGWGELQET